MQATWGVFDKDNILRQALSDSLHECGSFFYTRWKNYEISYHQAALLHFTLENHQWEEDWKSLLALVLSIRNCLNTILLCLILRPINLDSPWNNFTFLFYVIYFVVL